MLEIVEPSRPTDNIEDHESDENGHKKVNNEEYSLLVVRNGKHPEHSIVSFNVTSLGLKEVLLTWPPGFSFCKIVSHVTFPAKNIREELFEGSSRVYFRIQSRDKMKKEVSDGLAP